MDKRETRWRWRDSFRCVFES